MHYPVEPLDDQAVEDLCDILRSLSGGGRHQQHDTNWMSSSMESFPNQNIFQCPPAVNSDSVNMTGNGDYYARYLETEENLAASKLEIVSLREENKKLLESLQNAENAIAVIDEVMNDRDRKVCYLEAKIKTCLEENEHLRLAKLQMEGDAMSGKRELNKSTDLVKKLYLVAGTVLTGLGGSVPPLDMMVEGVNAKSVEQLCSDLESKFSIWQGSHRLLHSELEKTLQSVEGLDNPERDDYQAENADDADEKISSPGSSLSSFTSPEPLTEQSIDSNDSFGMARRNPLRNCRLATSSYDERSMDHTACMECENAFRRLTRHFARLSRENKKKRSASPKTMIKSKNRDRPKPPKRTLARLAVKDMSSKDMSGALLPILPSEQTELRQKSVPPLKKGRCL